MMNDCADGDMRDRLPGYVHGTLTAAERSAVAAHLATCADCSAEVELIRAASRAFVAPAVNVKAIVAALPAPPRRTARFAFAGRAQQIAAAIAIIAIGALSAVMLRDRPYSSTRVASARPAPVDTSTTLAAAAPPPASTPAASNSAAHERRMPARAASGRATMSFGGGLSDLSDEQLDTLLGELDGLDALPSVEPETHITPILPPADGGHGAH